jgi:hypothetical protein
MSIDFPLQNNEKSYPAGAAAFDDSLRSQNVRFTILPKPAARVPDDVSGNLTFKSFDTHTWVKKVFSSDQHFFTLVSRPGEFTPSETNFQSYTYIAPGHEHTFRIEYQREPITIKYPADKNRGVTYSFPVYQYYPQNKYINAKNYTITARSISNPPEIHTPEAEIWVSTDTGTTTKIPRHIVESYRELLFSENDSTIQSYYWNNKLIKLPRQVVEEFKDPQPQASSSGSSLHPPAAVEPSRPRTTWLAEDSSEEDNGNGSGSSWQQSNYRASDYRAPSQSSYPQILEGNTARTARNTRSQESPLESYVPPPPYSPPHTPPENNPERRQSLFDRILAKVGLKRT